jgi:mono/diheme cytochrome c family protein
MELRTFLLEGSMQGIREGWVVGLFLLLGALAVSNPTGAAQTPASTPALSEKAQRGKNIFTDRCFVCHDVDSERVPRIGPPPLDGLFKKRALINGKPVNDANVTEMIKFGPTPNMPAFRYTLTDAEISDVVEFLKVK